MRNGKSVSLLDAPYSTNDELLSLLSSLLENGGQKQTLRLIANNFKAHIGFLVAFYNYHCENLSMPEEWRPYNLERTFNKLIVDLNDIKGRIDNFVHNYYWGDWSVEARSAAGIVNRMSIDELPILIDNINILKNNATRRKKTNNKNHTNTKKYRLINAMYDIIEYFSRPSTHAIHLAKAVHIHSEFMERMHDTGRRIVQIRHDPFIVYEQNLWDNDDFQRITTEIRNEMPILWGKKTLEVVKRNWTSKMIPVPPEK